MREDGKCPTVTRGCYLCVCHSRLSLGGASQKALHLRPFSRDRCAVAQQERFFFLFFFLIYFILSLKTC